MRIQRTHSLSPMKLIASTERVINNPSQIHDLLLMTVNCCTSLIMLPELSLGGLLPSPNSSSQLR